MRTIEEIRNLFQQRGYILLSQEYHSNKQYLIFEKDGYKYYNTYNGFIKTDNFKKWSDKNPYSVENMNLYFERNQIPCRVISQTYNYKRMTFQCKCGNTYEANFGNVLKSQTQCPKCGRNNAALLHRKDETFFQTLEKLGLELLEEYKGLKKSHYFKTKEGFIIKVVPWNLLRRDEKQYVYYDIRNEYSLDNMKLYLEKNHPGITLISDKYVGAKETYEFQCSCGERFNSIWQWFVRGVGTKCQKCTKKMSSLELKTKEWLEENNIDYIAQKTFDGCRDINLLKFDFFLTEYNAVIEVDGEQHYRPVAFGGKNHIAIEEFNNNKKHDFIKNEYCKKNNIKMLRLPYFDFDEKELYKEKLQTFIS